MSMIRRDFEAIAKIINENIILAGEGKGQILTEDFIKYMGNYFQETYNGAYEFDRERFIKACYKGIENDIKRD